MKFSGIVPAVSLLCVFFARASGAAPDSPCSSTEAHQFDFWVGDWDVVDTAGHHIGRNTITRILNGCVLEEHWTGDGGLEGKSFNVFVAAHHQWHQTWVDSRGGMLMLDGAFANGTMTLSGERRGKDGKTVINRITWTPLSGGDVEQRWDMSTDNGKSWNQAFLGIYKKRLKQ